MNLVIAFVKPYKIEEVFAALEQLGIHGATLTEVRVTGPEGPRSRAPRAVELVPMLKLEIAVAGTNVDETVRVLASAARTRHPGDGSILVMPLLEAVRIRTDERATLALT